MIQQNLFLKNNADDVSFLNQVTNYNLNNFKNNDNNSNNNLIINNDKSNNK